MALAKKCDRCGKLYEHYPNPMPNTDNMFSRLPKDTCITYNAVQRVLVDECGRGVVVEDHKDLCSECMEAINVCLNITDEKGGSEQ